MKPNEIKIIQTGGIDYFGHPLMVDGSYGPKTEWWHQVSALEVERQRLLRVALGYHASGMKEDINNSIANDGVFVDRCLKPANLKNKPWCIAFVSLCIREAGIPWKEYHVSAWSLIQWAKKHGYTVSEPTAGDLFAFLYPIKPGDADRKGHGGIVTGFGDVSGKKYISDVDGNVGDAVRAGRRLVADDMVFIRIPGTGTGKPVKIPPNLMRLDNLGDR